MKEEILFNYPERDVYIPEGLQEFAEFLTVQLARIPLEFRSTAKIEISSGESWGSSYHTVEIRYMRPFTEAETVAKERQHRIDAERRKAELKRTIAQLEEALKKP